MKIYWTNKLNGVIIAVAESEEQARTIIINKAKGISSTQPKKFKIHQLKNTKEPYAEILFDGDYQRAGLRINTMRKLELGERVQLNFATCPKGKIIGRVPLQIGYEYLVKWNTEEVSGWLVNFNYSTEIKSLDKITWIKL